MNNSNFSVGKRQGLVRSGLLAIPLLIFGHLAYSQQEMSLDDCIRMAVGKNIGIQRQGLQVEMAADNLQTARASRLPGVEGFYAHNLSSGKTVNYEDYTYINTQYQDGNLGLQGTMPIFTGLGNWYLSKSARYTMQSETDRKEELVKALTIDVTAAYLQILYNEEMLGLTNSKLESSREQLRMNEGFFAAGRMSKVEVSTMKAQVAQDNLARIQAENDVRTAYLTLAQLLNYENPNSLRISKPSGPEGDLSTLIGDPEKIIEFAQVNHPGISSAELLVKSREAGLSASMARLSPSVSLNGVVYSRYSELGVNQLNPAAAYPYSEQLKDNMYGRASVNVSIPIFSQFQNRSRINQSRLQAMDARLSLEQKKLAIRQDIQLAHSAAVNARARYEASSEAIASANESFNLTQEKYRAGLSSAVEFKVAQNQLIQAQLARIQSKYDFLIRTKILDLYLDKPISLE